MMKEVVRAMETGILAQIGLIAFLVAFVLMVIYAFTLSKRKREYDKNLPLDDAPELPRASSDNGNRP
ncbi:MAG: cbb3-type cytochrome c oxidase subunit 3 [Rhodothermales bacterium]